MAPEQEVLKGYLFDFLQHKSILRVLVRIASSSTHNIPFLNMKTRNSPLIILNLRLCDFSKRLKNEFEIAVVKEHQCSSHFSSTVYNQNKNRSTSVSTFNPPYQ